ncbi:VWA domain-containing protein [uncultured Friedmanniella sp.]|uniref:vWA domain-containing protein n=1 Tax=uncultured Friedmanniella sp. TaxID=335381 RepID=UPI0035CA5387
MPITRLGRRLALAMLSVLLVAAGSWVASPRASADESTKVLLLLDVSGSMNERISSGGTKFAAAKKALKQVASALPAGTQVGLRVYGSTIAEPKAQNPKACTDTKLVLPIGPLNTSRMDKAVDSFTAKGETPIAYSLGKSVDDLGSSGKRVLILISDGEETCSGDPCPTARKLAKSGVDLQFNAIGLDVGAKARKQLQCIAAAGDGSYYDAGNSGALQDAVRKLTQRALRPFEVSGTPVKGTLKSGDAPEIGAGQYRDRYDVSNKPRYYTINRTPGSLVTASIGTVVKPFGIFNADQWSLKLTTMDGEVCSTTQTASGTLTAASVYGGVVRSEYPPGAGSTAPPACATDPQLRWSLSRQAPGGGAADVPVELVVAEQPPVTNLATLPGPVSGYDGRGKAVGKSGTVHKVVGGSGFSNAPEIGAGTWSDTVTVGETVVYRVPLDVGQRLRATVTAPSGPERGGLDSNEAVTTHLTLYSPARVAMKELYENASLAQKATVTAASPQVRVRNRETPLAGNGNAASVSPDSSTASVAGDYFVGIKLDPIQKTLTGSPMSVRVSVAVDGKPAGQPQYASTASPSPTPDASVSPSPSPAPVTPAPSSSATTGAPPSGSSGRGFAVGLLSGLGVVVVLAAGVGLLLRRRSRSR